MVIYDRSGEFVKSYYDPSIDKILNPLDARCAAWDLWKECLTQPDFDNTANTLIPMGTKPDVVSCWKAWLSRRAVPLSLTRAKNSP